MDIGKYIGKFLIKNKYCSLSGLGVFELKKIPAYELKNEMANPSHLVTFTPIGSIDDTFASFIASFENVSISNASNNIKEYCINAKEEISKTGKFEIENLGKLTSSNRKIVFQQNADLDLGFASAPITPIEIKPISAETQEKIKEDFSYPPANTTYLRAKQTNWLKIAIPVLAIAGIAIAGYFGYNYYKNNLDTKNEPTINAETPAVQIDTIANTIDTTTAIQQADTTKKDTVTTTIDTVAKPTQPTAIGKEFKVSVFSFDNEASATAKVNKLNGYGNKASVVNSNGQFIVTLLASNPSNDTLKIVDSLRRFFNPKGQVHIMN